MIEGIKKNIPYYLFFFVLVVYVANLSRSVYGGDVGDLVTAAFSAGVPHPPGYPLFTLLGLILIKIGSPFSDSPAFLVGLISASSSALAVAMYYKTMSILLKSRLIPLIASLILAFTYLFWFYAEIAEVFALNNFFGVILLSLALLYRKTVQVRYLYFLAFSTGLSLTNHHTILFLFPALFILIAAPLWKQLKKNKKTLLICLALGLAGFSVYIYIYFASLTNPIVDWADLQSPTDIKSLLDLILRRRYGTFQAGSFAPPDLAERLIILKIYFFQIVTQITIPTAIFSLLGFFAIFKREKIIAIAILLGFLLTGPLFHFYAGFPLFDVFRFGIYERFITLSVVVLLFFVPFGIERFIILMQRLRLRSESLSLIKMVFLIIPLMLFLYNFPKTNLANVWIGDNFGADHLISLPRNSILFLSGDTNLFNTWYMHYVKGVRPDVILLNAVDPLQSNQILAKSARNIKQGKEYLDGINAMKQNIVTLSPTHPVISDIEMKGYKTDFYWVPYGFDSLLFLNKADEPSEKEYKDVSDRLWSQLHVPFADRGTLATGNLTIADIPHYYANGLLRTGNYFADEYNNQAEAERYYKLALKVEPDYEKAYFALGVLYWSKRSDCSNGVKYMDEAIQSDPTERRFYQVLYIAMKSCRYSENDLHSLVKTYTERFKSDLTKDITKNK